MFCKSNSALTVGFVSALKLNAVAALYLCLIPVFAVAQNTYSIKGQITYGNNPLSNISVTLSGSSSGTKQTDAQGNYSFSGLTEGGNYTITPSSSGYNFNPASQTVNNLRADQTINFAASLNCSLALNSENITVPALGGSRSFTISSPSGCFWSASSNSSWIRVTNIFLISSNSTVNFDVSVNRGAERVGTITIGDKTFTVTQEAQNLSALRRIVFSWAVVTSTSNFFYSVNIANSDGSGEGALTIPQITSASNPVWSPEGRRIAYTDDGLNSRDIFVMTADGRNKLNLTNTASINESLPSWSVTGKIAYVRNNQIWLMNDDGSNQMQFPGISFAAADMPDWSPDGGKLAFVSGKDIYVINSDGTNLQRITNSPDEENNPDWSPDGTRIVFDKTDTGIFVINTDGTNENQLTFERNDRNPSWSPDNTKIAFSGSRSFPPGSGANTTSGIFLMDINGANQVNIIANETRQSRGGVDWRPAIKPTRFDFDGDGRADISVFRNGTWYFSRFQSGFTGINWGLATDQLAPADFDGDGRTDIAVFREGYWFSINSSNSAIKSTQFGQAGDFPVPADFTGDGKDDVAVFRPSHGTWYWLDSATGAFRGAQFGATGDKPLIGDFDGDGRADLAVVRTNGNNLFWYWLESSTNQFRAVRFGLSTDLATSADFDGDGKTDVSVFRASNGTWYRLNSPQSDQFIGIQFGSNGDLPVPADYDGDGKADISVFRSGIWYRLNSLNNAFIGEQFGIAADKPLPNVFVR